MLKVFATPQNRKWTFLFLGAFIVFTIASIIVGISDNIPGVVLAFFACAALVLAFVHHWRTTRQFLFLVLGSFLAFVLFGFTHGFFEMAGSKMGFGGFLEHVMQVIGGTFFMTAVLLCPAGFLVGIVGAFIMAFRSSASLE